MNWFYNFPANPVTPSLVLLLGNFLSPKVLSIVHTEKLDNGRVAVVVRLPSKCKAKRFMKSALSRNEMEILDRHVATLTNQLSEIANLLESRLGETNELATSARNAQREFARFAHRVRRQTVVVRGQAQPESKSQTA
jgi:hypothetical protein